VAHPAGAEAQDGLGLKPPDQADLVALASRLQELALVHAATVATAESCTGGLVGHAITLVAGSSAYYLGGVIAYADRVKIELLGVAPALIERHGAVSAQVAEAMAVGVRDRSGADLAASVTGVAGPTGGTADKPLGLTFIGVASEAGTAVERFMWPGDRAGNQAFSAAATLESLTALLAASPPSQGPA
jgi:PncC family amidohydrolase